MDRRNFLRTMGTAAAVAAVSGTELGAVTLGKDKKKKASVAGTGLRVRFLGTGVVALFEESVERR